MKVNLKAIQETLKTAVSNINEKKATVVAAVVPASAALLSVAAFAEEGSSGTFVVPSIASKISADAFNGILQQMVDLLPLLLPVIVGCLAFRKGISFLKSMIAGA